MRASSRALSAAAVALLSCAASPTIRQTPASPIAEAAPAPSSGPRANVVPASPSDLDPALLRAAGVDPAALHCTRDNRWGGTLKADAKAGAADLMALVSPSLAGQNLASLAELQKKLEGLLMWRMVRAVLLEGDNHNLGVIALKGRTWMDERGPSPIARPVLIFRSGFTPEPGKDGSCFSSLLGAGGVRHVLNLFDGEIPAADLVSAESEAARRAGAGYHTATDDTIGSGYGPWRDILRKHPEDGDERRAATASVARLIREQILMPEGAAPRGNVHVHCGGGMHRTGMIIGIVERCINGEDPSVVEANYKRHVGWQDPARPGGYEEGNLRFIREFDCALLR